MVGLNWAVMDEGKAEGKVEGKVEVKSVDKYTLIPRPEMDLGVLWPCCSGEFYFSDAEGKTFGIFESGIFGRARQDKKNYLVEIPHLSLEKIRELDPPKMFGTKLLSDDKVLELLKTGVASLYAHDACDYLGFLEFKNADSPLTLSMAMSEKYKRHLAIELERRRMVDDAPKVALEMLKKDEKLASLVGRLLESLGEDCVVVDDDHSRTVKVDNLVLNHLTMVTGNHSWISIWNGHGNPLSIGSDGKVHLDRWSFGKLVFGEAELGWCEKPPITLTLKGSEGIEGEGEQQIVALPIDELKRLYKLI